MIHMELVGVRVELPSNSPIVLLREQVETARLLPIFIGGPEATSIALAVENVETPRPMTHDLIKNIFEELGLTLARVVVTDLKEKTFYAELEIEGPDGSHRISSRPSDAIALAVRTGTPIYAEESVLDAAGYRADEAEEGEDEEVLEQFREFIDNVTPEDFDG